MKKLKALILLSVILVFALSFYSTNSFSDENQNNSTQSIQKTSSSIQDNSKKETNNLQNSTNENSSTTDKKVSSNSLKKLFELGGIFMWPLLLFSVVVLGVFFERILAFSKRRFNIKAFSNTLIQTLKEDGIEAAIEICKKNPKNIAAPIFELSLKSLKDGQSVFEKSVESVSNVEINRLEKNLNILSSMGNIAPLTGFLGTVSGMITAFEAIASSNNVTAHSVAGGIYKALITTAFGLIIAIVAVTANNFFVHKVDSCISQIEEVATLIAQNNHKG